MMNGIRGIGASGKRRDRASSKNELDDLPPLLVIWLNEATVECNAGHMSEYRKTTAALPDIPGFPKDWRDEIKADLDAQLQAGGTLYGVRSDGAYVARTKDGEQVLSMPDRESA